MTRAGTHVSEGAREQEEARESRLSLALLRGVIENLRPNRIVMPLFAIGVCGLFALWVKPLTLVSWYGLALLGLLPQELVARALPRGNLSTEAVRKWRTAASLANLCHVIGWSLFGVMFWVPGNDMDHLLIELVLAVSLSAHAPLVGASRVMAIPSFAWFGLALTLVPLQGYGEVYAAMACLAPFYAAFVALTARHSHVRARSALVLAEERNVLLAELVHAKLESDRGREKAEAASLAKSQFLANMSHELRTPLNAIIGFSEMISSRIFQDEPERNVEYAGLIHSSGLHLLALITDILDLAKIEAGRWTVEESAIDLSRLTADVLQLVTWKAGDTGVTLEVAIPSSLPWLKADPRAIKQVLINLLSNGVKFTPKGGTVRVFAYLDAQDCFCFGVSDTGVGIAAEDQAHIFDSFGQGKHDVAIADKGTGLGLAIVKGLTEAHGGEVRLTSDVGHGTQVTVVMPPSRVMRAESRRAAG